MTLEEAIERVGDKWHTGMDDYFTYDEILELEEMLKELRERRESNKRVYDKLKVERAMFDDSRFLLSNYEAGYDDGIKRAMALMKERGEAGKLRRGEDGRK